MDVLAALLPIVVVLVAMVGARWTAARAGVVGLAVTLVLAVGVFGLGTEVLADAGIGGAVGGALLEAVFTAVVILWIVIPALAIHNLQIRTGGTEVLRGALAQLSADPRVTALLVAWFFALFMEGAAGFGASVALAAPFLVSAGFSRVEAVTAALIGHSVGVSFGAVGTPVLPQITATGLSGVELSRAAGTYHALLGWIPLLIVVWLVSRMTAEGPWTDLLPSRTVWALTAVAGVGFLGPFAALAFSVGPELPTLGGALVGGGMFIAVLVVGRRRGLIPAVQPAVAGGATPTDAAPTGPSERPVDDIAGSASARQLLIAGAPYLVLVGVVLVTRLVPPLTEALTSVVWRWQIGETFSGSVEPLYHPGTVLAVGFVAGVVANRLSGTDVRRVVTYTVSKLGPVAVALLGMLGLSRLMVHAGMTDVLAVAAAGAAGGLWPLLAPFVGTLGTFVTGSATASNILFTDFQVSTAQTADLPLATIAGAQNFGAATGNIICPHNIVAAGATVDLAGAEGEILRHTLWVAVLYAAVGGLLALLVLT